MGLRERKIMSLQEQQKKLKGLNPVERTVEERLGMKSMGMGRFGGREERKLVPLRKEKLLGLKAEASKLKEPVPRISKRSLFY